MDLVLILLMVFGAVLAVGYPLVNAWRYKPIPSLAGAGDQLETLETAREMALEAIRDLEFEHMTGKLSDADYAQLRATYEGRAVRVLQQLDSLQAVQTRAGSPGKSASKARDKCPRCQTALQPRDKFCPRCGAKTA